MRIKGALLFSVLIAVGGCRGDGDHAAEPAEASPYPSDPGYEPVDPALPHLRFHGQWLLHRGDAEPAPVSMSQLEGQRIVVQGKMLLGDTEPYPSSFVAGPAYPGCVHPNDEGFMHGAVQVELPPGRRVEVTDHPLLIEGTVRDVRRRGDEGPAFRLEGATVEQLPLPVPLSPKRRN